MASLMDTTKIYKSKIESLNKGYNFETFVETVTTHVAEDYGIFNMEAVTPALQLEIAKKTIERQPVVMNLDFGDQKISMTSDLIVPAEPLHVVFHKSRFSEPVILGPHFTFALSIDGIAHAESGTMYLDNILSTSVAKGGVKDKSIDPDERKTVMFAYDMHNDATYALFSENHLPVMTVYFEMSYFEGENIVLQLESVRLIVRYDPTETRVVLPPGYTSVFNVTRIPYQLVTMMPSGDYDIAPRSNIVAASENLVERLEALPGVVAVGIYSGETKQQTSLTVKWGSITDLAISSAIQILTKKIPNALDNPLYVADILEHSDTRGKQLLDALVRVYGSKELLPTLRQLMMHTSGLVESFPESFFNGFLDVLSKATEVMATTKLFSFIPTFTSTNEVEEVRLISSLNTMQVVQRAVPGASFVVNLMGNTGYDYAVLAMLIKRMDDATLQDPNVTAQDIITKKLRLGDRIFWNVQHSKDGRGLTDGPKTIFTLRDGISSSLEVMGGFVKQISGDDELVKSQIVDRVMDVSENSTGQDNLFRTMVWQGSYLEANPVPFFFRTSSVLDSQESVVYMSPHLGLVGAATLVVREGAGIAAMLVSSLFGSVAGLAAMVEQVAEDTVMELVELGSEAVQTTGRIAWKAIPGQMPLSNMLKPGTTFTSPFMRVGMNVPSTVEFKVDEEDPIDRVVVVNNQGNIQARLIIDHHTGHILRLGGRVQTNSTERYVNPEPVVVDHKMYKDVDDVYYANPNEGAPALLKISSNINAFHGRLSQTPASNMVQPKTISPTLIEPLSQEPPGLSFHELPIQHCHKNNPHKRSFVHAQYRLPTAQF